MNVARIYEIERKFAPAEHLHARCMQAFADQNGPESPDVAYTMFSLAALYVAQVGLRVCLALKVQCIVP